VYCPRKSPACIARKAKGCNPELGGNEGKGDGWGKIPERVVMSPKHGDDGGKRKHRCEGGETRKKGKSQFETNEV